MTTLCSSCGSRIPEGAQVCVHCGAAGSAPAAIAAEPAASSNTAPVSAPLFSSVESLDGLSGWLILVGFGLVVSPFVTLSTLVTVNLPFLYNAKYQPFLSSHPALAGLLLFEVITNIIFILGVLALNFLFFTKRKAFPTFMIIYLATQCCLILFDALATHVLLPSTNLAGSYAAIARPFMAALIWIPYFLISRRVKATFVR